MAKRRRLMPAQSRFLTADPGAEVAETPAVLSPQMLAPSLGAAPAPRPGPPPIAQVAADGAAQAALAELAAEIEAARAEGRLLLALPLGVIDPGHLVRDRMETDEEELGHLIESLRAHGQRTPIEVAPLPPAADGTPRYGLISGWRRLTALGRLAAATGEARFARVLAQLRRPETAAEAYVSMVEENEVRLGLSYYERARIAAKAVEQGVFETEKQALQRLFSNASRSRRSKIGSFLEIYRTLDPVLRFPAALPERLGLSLVRLIETDPQARDRLAADLAAQPAQDAGEEMARLTAAVERAAGAAETGSVPAERRVPSAPPRPAAPAAAPAAQEVAPGILLETGGGWLRPVLTLSGSRVDQDFRDRLIAWLQQG